MTLEEAMELVDQGNVNAMCEVGNYYCKQGNGEGYSEGLKYFELAANQNNLYALHMTVILKKLFAYATLQIDPFNVKEWEEVVEWSKKEIYYISIHGITDERVDSDSAFKMHYETLYYLALCHMFLDNYELAVELLKNNGDTKSRILNGFSLMRLSLLKEEYDIEELKYAIYDLSIIDGNTQYSSCDKGYYEERVFVLATIALANEYRLGVINKNKPNLQKSLDLLLFVKESLKDSSNKDLLSYELSHYKKTLFGNYNYVE